MSVQTSERQPHLALVCMHGPPEITGLALLESHQRNPIEGWDVEVANEAARRANRRYVTYNMATQFRGKPPAVRTDENYELWRPEEVKELTRGRKTSLEIHDTPRSEGEYVAV